jgi:hypothetical protein
LLLDFPLFTLRTRTAMNLRYGLSEGLPTETPRLAPDKVTGVNAGDRGCRCERAWPPATLSSVVRPHALESRGFLEHDDHARCSLTGGH